MRIGIGYDAHRLAENRSLVLGGVRVPFDKGLLGHSDADVLTHAVIDALLGAAGIGDIGMMFPDSDMRYKDAPSIELLKTVGETLAERNFRIINIDSVIIAEKPKLSAYFGAMRDNIAGALGIGAEDVNIKAKTEEGMGFTGTGEGMAAHAVCSGLYEKRGKESIFQKKVEFL